MNWVSGVIGPNGRLVKVAQTCNIDRESAHSRINASAMNVRHECVVVVVVVRLVV